MATPGGRVSPRRRRLSGTLPSGPSVLLTLMLLVGAASQPAAARRQAETHYPVALTSAALSPAELSATREENAATACDALRGEVLSDGVVAPEGPWLFGSIADDQGEQRPCGRQPVRVLLERPGRPTEALAGVVACDLRWLVLRASLPEDRRIPDLHLEAIRRVVNWPDGLEAMGAVAYHERDGGISVTHSVPETPADRLLSPQLGGWWPMRLSSWSDGRTWILEVHLVFPADTESSLITPRPDVLSLDVPFRRGGYGLSVHEYGSAAKLTSASDVIDSVPTIEGIRLVDDLFTTERLSTPPPPVDDWVPTLPPADAEWEKTDSRPPEGVRAIVEAVATAEAAHPVVRGGREPDTGTWLYSVHRSVGRITRPLCVVTWAPGHCAVSVVELHPRDRPPGFEWDQARHVEQALTSLLGANGRRLGLVPMERWPLGQTDWVVFSPDPDHRIGWEGETRVGDTPWGRCRIYVHPGILHIVFDLTEEGE